MLKQLEQVLGQMAPSDAAGLTTTASAFLAFTRSVALAVVIEQPVLQPVLAPLLLPDEETSGHREHLLSVSEQWRVLFSRAYASGAKTTGDGNFAFHSTLCPDAVCAEMRPSGLAPKVWPGSWAVSGTHCGRSKVSSGTWHAPLSQGCGRCGAACALTVGSGRRCCGSPRA